MTSPSNASDNSFGFLEGLMGQIAQHNANLQEVQREIAELRGEGTAAEGRVRAEVGPNGTLLDVQIDARAMKLGSEAVAAAVLEAAKKATDDVNTRTEEMLRPLVESMMGTSGRLAGLPTGIDIAETDVDDVLEGVKKLRRRLDP